MKKTAIILAVAIIGLSACGGGDAGLKKDIEEGTKLDCQKDKLRAKLDAGDSTVLAEYEKVKKELDALGEKFGEKYKDKMDDKSFEEKAKKLEKEAKEKYCK